MSILPANLRNARHFPTFDACPNEDVLDFDYYRSTGGSMFHPSRHWCLLAEIVEVMYFFRLRLTVKDRSGKTFPVAFYLEDDSTAPIQCRVGDTIAILYANQHGFLDMTVGIRQEEMCTVKVCTEQSLRAMIC